MTLSELSKKLGTSEQWLRWLFAIESNNDSTAVNRFTGATGLIQFMPATARRLGTSCSELRVMGYENQLDYVYRYLAPYKGRFTQFIDLYFAVFFPLAIGKPDGYVLVLKNISASKIAQQNPQYDRNKDGKITVGEVKEAIKKYMV